MCGPKPKYPIKLTTEEERELRRVANSRNVPHVKVILARILLAAHNPPAAFCFWPTVNCREAEGKGRTTQVAAFCFASLPCPGGGLV